MTGGSLPGSCAYGFSVVPCENGDHAGRFVWARRITLDGARECTPPVLTRQSRGERIRPEVPTSIGSLPQTALRASTGPFAFSRANWLRDDGVLPRLRLRSALRRAPPGPEPVARRPEVSWRLAQQGGHMRCDLEGGNTAVDHIADRPRADAERASDVGLAVAEPLELIRDVDSIHGGRPSLTGVDCPL